ncbi:DNA polymerase III subunit epsilon [Psychromonas marina]|uniref:DNA-directed DNA polymerase n=1 Tax=Psychromonas marina TaxID=88364 RepID=A0ABQ6E2L1_9GAMM|nr:3'-5' exonuclease [Psychromonas marina]GLS91448.1 DNA polymerase III subunit epsilon [Psychromonas marina]
MRADSVVILDFETTGLSPDQGDRAIEIGAVRLINGEVKDQFQALMDPGFRVSSFIESYTGISNQMLSQAESCKQVMNEFADYIGDDNLIAHNASFDSRFLNAELMRIGRQTVGNFSCSLLLSRRIFQDADSHKLGELIRYANIPSSGGFHRALYDAQMTSQLWLALLNDIAVRYDLHDLSFAQIQKICKTPKGAIDKLLNKWAQI